MHIPANSNRHSGIVPFCRRLAIQSTNSYLWRKLLRYEKIPDSTGMHPCHGRLQIQFNERKNDPQNSRL